VKPWDEQEVGICGSEVRARESVLFFSKLDLADGAINRKEVMKIDPKGRVGRSTLFVARPLAPCSDASVGGARAVHQSGVEFLAITSFCAGVHFRRLEQPTDGNWE